MSKTETTGWLRLSWKVEGGAPAEEVANRIRQGAEEGSYWLRAYAVIEDRAAVVLYPLRQLQLVERKLASGGEAAAVSIRVRQIRSDGELERIAADVERLPIRFGAAVRPADYPWSSAGWTARISLALASLSRPRTAP